jgi:hypothetical protein
MRKTQLGAGWTKRPSPVLRGRSAESSTGQRAATYKILSFGLLAPLQSSPACPHLLAYPFTRLHRGHRATTLSKKSS